MTTFSQLVDQMVSETRRLDLRNEIASYLNQTIRELHFDSETNNLHLLRDNLTEIQLTAAVETQFVWEIPNPQLWQAIQTVRYDNVFVDNEPCYPPELVPSRGLIEKRHYYYRAGRIFAFMGFGGIGSKISIAWYEYPRRLKYKLLAERPASWDDESGWSYLEEYNVNDEARAVARELSSNWILDRWQELLEEGLRAKVYKRLSDTERARTSYSMFTSLRTGFISSEEANVGGYQ